MNERTPTPRYNPVRVQHSEDKEKALKASRENSHILRVSVQKGIKFLKSNKVEDNGAIPSEF